MTGYGSKFIWRDSDAFSLYSPTEETERRPENNRDNTKKNILRQPVLRRYPVGSIQPCGWLRTQLQLHASGMGGTLDTFWPYIKNSRWFGGYLPDERDVPDSVIYWLDGLIPMAWQLNDPVLQEKCHRYVGQLLDRQQENGWLCPEGPVPEELDKSVHNRSGMFIMSEFTDGWPLFGIMKPLIQYYEATGDERIPQAIKKALRCLDYLLDKLSLRNWGSLRWSEGLISIYWLYERTSEPWLLQLAQKLRCQGFDWNELYRNETTWPYAAPLEQCHWSALNHVVNTSMAVKSGPLFYRLSGREFDFTAPKRMLSLLDRYHGFVTGMFSGDEGFAGNVPIQGSELCGVVELMYSLEETLSITGELSYADRLEKAEDFKTTLNEMIRKTIKDHKNIIFNGNGYDDSWIKEATEKRGLLNYRTTPDCMPHLLDKKNVDMLTAHGVYSKAELESRCEIMLENYCKTVVIEANTMVSMAKRQIAPAVEAYAADVAKSAAAKKALDQTLACGYETGLVRKLSVLTDRIALKADELQDALLALHNAEDIEAESYMIRDTVLNLMGELRLACDESETLTAKKYWPFPTYADLLFGVK